MASSQILPKRRQELAQNCGEALAFPESLHTTHVFFKAHYSTVNGEHYINFLIKSHFLVTKVFVLMIFYQFLLEDGQMTRGYPLLPVLTVGPQYVMCLVCNEA